MISSILTSNPKVMSLMSVQNEISKGIGEILQQLPVCTSLGWKIEVWYPDQNYL